MSVTAYIGLGSNLGDRRENLQRAIQMLGQRAGVVVTRQSSFYDTAPVGGPPGQGNYLNAVIEIQTALSPRELLDVLLEVERQLGRERLVRFGPRTIDLDLLLHGKTVVKEPDLEVPHPRLHERGFVLEPLAEIAPDLVHPRLGQTIRQLREQLPRQQPSASSRPLLGFKALVTGSTSGIGRAIVLALAAAGANVIIHGRRLETAQAVAAAAAALGVEAGVQIVDLADIEQCRRLVEQVWSQHGPLDIWINNAGADILTGAVHRQPFLDKLQLLFEVDVRATILLSRDVGQRMKQRGHGVILNMGWDRAEMGMEGDSGELFSATKGAVMAFTRSLAISLAPEVRVNCLAPGWIRTAWGEGASSYWQERVRCETPLGRWGTPEDVAAVACWLASPQANYLTGQIIRINGGAVR